MNITNSSDMLMCSNLSREIVSDLFVVEDPRKTYLLCLSVLYVLYLLVGLPWNLLVLGIILKQKLYQQPTILLLLNLVVTDLLILLFPLTMKTVVGLPGEFVLGNSDHVRCEMCRAELIVSSIVNTSAVLTVSVMAFDRFFFIHKPFKYEKLISVKTYVAAIIVIWLLSIFYASLGIGILGDVILIRTLLECNWDFTKVSYFHLISILFLLVPYIFLLVCDVWVVIIVLRNIKMVYGGQKSSSMQNRRQSSVKKLNDQMKQTRKKKRLHLMRVFGGIIVVATLASLPWIILGVLTFEPGLIRAEFSVIAAALFYSQVVINPILESTLIKEIKAPILKLLNHSLHLCKSRKSSIPCCSVALQCYLCRHSERKMSRRPDCAGPASPKGTFELPSKANYCIATNQENPRTQILVSIEKEVQSSTEACQKEPVPHFEQESSVSKNETETISFEVKNSSATYY